MRCTDPWVLRSTPNHTPNQQDALPPRLHVVKHFWHLLLSGSAAGDSQGPAALYCLNTPSEPHHSTSSTATSRKRIPLFCSSSNIIRFSSTFSLFYWRGGGSPSRLYCFALFRSQTLVMLHFLPFPITEPFRHTDSFPGPKRHPATLPNHCQFKPRHSFYRSCSTSKGSDATWN